MSRQILARPRYLAKLPVAHRSFYLKKGKNHRRSAKLDWDKVKEIRESSESSESLASNYGVHKETIRDVRSGKTWIR